MGTFHWLSSGPVSACRGYMNAKSATTPQCCTPVMLHLASLVCICSVVQIWFRLCTFELKSRNKAELLLSFPQSLLPPFLAAPTLSVPQQWVVLETESQLKCHAEGFYPPPVSFSWTRDGQVIRPPDLVEAEQTPNGYYMAVGNLTFYPSREDQNVTFGCKVTHNGSYQELDFQLNVTCEWHKDTVHYS